MPERRMDISLHTCCFNDVGSVMFVSLKTKHSQYLAPYKQ